MTTDVREPTAPPEQEQRALVVAPPPERTSIALWGTDNPRAMTARMAEVADAMAAVVEDRHLFTMIQERKYVNVEGWAMVGAMLGVFPSTRRTDVVESGFLPEVRVQKRGRNNSTYEKVYPAHDGAITFRASVVLMTRDGGIVGGAEAMCSRREESWRDRDDNQIASMAQTRATAKAFRMSFGFIMPMSGYAPTPAEEMEGIETSFADAPAQEPRARQAAGGAPATPRERAARQPREPAALVKLEEVVDVRTLMMFANQQRVVAGLKMDQNAVLRALGVAKLPEVGPKYTSINGGWSYAAKLVLDDIEIATGKPTEPDLAARVAGLSEGDRELYEQMVANGHEPEDALNIVMDDGVGEGANASDDDAEEPGS